MRAGSGRPVNGATRTAFVVVDVVEAPGAEVVVSAPESVAAPVAAATRTTVTSRRRTGALYCGPADVPVAVPVWWATRRSVRATTRREYEVSATDAVKTCLRKYATFTGTASRPEYWWFALFNTVGSLVLYATNVPALRGLWGLALLLPGLAVARAAPPRHRSLGVVAPGIDRSRRGRSSCSACPGRPRPTPTRRGARRRDGHEPRRRRPRPPTARRAASFACPDRRTARPAAPSSPTRRGGSPPWTPGRPGASTTCALRPGESRVEEPPGGDPAAPATVRWIDRCHGRAREDEAADDFCGDVHFRRARAATPPSAASRSGERASRRRRRLPTVSGVAPTAISRITGEGDSTPSSTAPPTSRESTHHDRRTSATREPRPRRVGGHSTRGRARSSRSICSNAAERTLKGPSPLRSPRHPSRVSPLLSCRVPPAPGGRRCRRGR